MHRVFRRGRRRRRVAFVTGLAAVIVLGMALPAWAHHPILSGETECTNGAHVISWTIENSQQNLPMTITSATAAIGATQYLVTGYTSPVGNGGTTHATTIVPGNVTGTIQLTVKASWPDHYTSTKDTSVTLVDTCVQPTTTTIATTTTTTTVPETTTTVPETTTTEMGATTTIATTTTTTPITGEGSTTTVPETTTTHAGDTTTMATTTTTPITGEGSTIPTLVNQATTTTQPSPATLPRTGSSSGYAVFFGLSSIAGGALLLIRRRSWAR